MSSESGQQTAVAIDQGYVGLPLAQAMNKAVLKVIGFDISPQQVTSMNAGSSRIDETTGDPMDRLAT